MDNTGYRIEGQLYQSEFSKVVYIKKEGCELKFIGKQFCRDFLDDYLEKEETISQKLYNKYSFVIPIRALVNIENQLFGIMDDVSCHGKFLEEIIRSEIHRMNEIGRIKIAFQIMEKLLSVLDVLHKEGIMHLDIHPGNIFIRSFHPISRETISDIDFDIQLIDFAESEMIGATNRRDRISYTRGFSAFEKLSIDSELSIPTDLYSVSAIAFYMITESIYEKERDWNFSQNVILNKLLHNFFKISLNYTREYRYQSAERMAIAVRKIIRCAHYIEGDEIVELINMAYDLEISPMDLKGFSDRQYRDLIVWLDNERRKEVIDTRKCEYIFQLLWKEHDVHVIHNSDRGLLINNGLAICNHTANYLIMMEVLEDVDANKTCLADEEAYINLILKRAEFYNDNLQFDKAIADIDRIIDYFEQQRNHHVYTLLGNGNSFKNSLFAKALSSKGRYLSFQYGGDSCQRELIIDCFMESLKEFGWDEIRNGTLDNDSIENCIITLGHLQFFFITSGTEMDRMQFESYLGFYLYGKAESLEISGNYTMMMNWLDELSRQVFDKQNPFPRYFPRYKLLLVLKAIYTWYLDKISEDEKAILYEKIVEVSEDIQLYSYHPFQLIFKYLGLIKNQLTGEVDNTLFERSVLCEPNGLIEKPAVNTLTIITYQTIAVFHKISEMGDEVKEMVRHELLERSRSQGWHELEEMLQVKPLDELLSYEYS